MNPKHARFIADLEHVGIIREINLLDAGTYTAAAAAEHLGCDVAAIANSLIFEWGVEPLLIMSNGAGKVDTRLVTQVLGGESLKRAGPEFVNLARGQVIGGVVPAGHPQRIKTLLDVSLCDYDPLRGCCGNCRLRGAA